MNQRVLSVCAQIRLDATGRKKTKQCPGDYKIFPEQTCGGKEEEKKPRKPKAQEKEKKPRKPKAQEKEKKPRTPEPAPSPPRRQPGEGAEAFLKRKHGSPVDKDGQWKEGYPQGPDYLFEVADAFLERQRQKSPGGVGSAMMGQNHAERDGSPGFPLLGKESNDQRGFAVVRGQAVSIENGDFRNIAGGKMRTMIRAIGGPLETKTSRPGRASMSFTGMENRNTELEEQIASKQIPGKLWTTNAFRQSAGWKWMTPPVETGTVSKSRQTKDQVGAILSVTQNLSGDHYYCLDMDTGTSPGVLTIQPDKPDEPKNLIGGFGHIVLGRPIGVIRNSNGQIHPVFDRIQISPPLTPDQPLVSVQSGWDSDRPSSKGGAPRYSQMPLPL